MCVTHVKYGKGGLGSVQLNSAWLKYRMCCFDRKETGWEYTSIRPNAKRGHRSSYCQLHSLSFSTQTYQKVEIVRERRLGRYFLLCVNHLTAFFWTGTLSSEWCGFKANPKIWPLWLTQRIEKMRKTWRKFDIKRQFYNAASAICWLVLPKPNPSKGVCADFSKKMKQEAYC